MEDSTGATMQDGDPDTHLQGQTYGLTYDWNEFKWIGQFDGFYLLTEIQVDVATASNFGAANGTGGTAAFRVRPEVSGESVVGYSPTHNGSGAVETITYAFAEELANQIRIDGQSHFYGPFLRVLEMRATGVPATVSQGAEIPITKAATWAFNDGGSPIFAEWPSDATVANSVDGNDLTVTPVSDPSGLMSRFAAEFSLARVYSFEIIHSSARAASVSLGISEFTVINSITQNVFIGPFHMNLVTDGTGNPVTQSSGVLLKNLRSISFGSWNSATPVNVHELRVFAAQVVAT
jgi:hypothetical protein